MSGIRQTAAFLAGVLAAATGCGLPTWRAAEIPQTQPTAAPAFPDSGAASAWGAGWPYSRVLGGFRDLLGLSAYLDLSSVSLVTSSGYPGQELFINGVPTDVGQIRALIDAPGQARVAGFIRQSGPNQIALVVPMLPGGATGSVEIRVSVRNAYSAPTTFAIARPANSAGSFEQVLQLVDGSSANGKMGTYGADLWADYAKSASNSESLISVYNGQSPTVPLDDAQRRMIDDAIWGANLTSELESVLVQAPTTFGYQLQYVDIKLSYEQIRRNIHWNSLDSKELYRHAARVASSLATYNYGHDTLKPSYLILRLMNAFPLLKELTGASLPKRLNGISAGSDELGCNRQDLTQWGTIKATGDFWLPGLSSTQVSRLAGAPLATLWPTAAYLNPGYAIAQFQAMANLTSASLARAGVVASGAYAIEPGALKADITPQVVFATRDATVNASPIMLTQQPVSEWAPYATANALVTTIQNNRFQMSQCGCARFEIQSASMPNGDLIDNAVLFTRGMNLSVTWRSCVPYVGCEIVPGDPSAKLVVQGATISPAFTGWYYWDGRDGEGNLVPQGVAVNAELWGPYAPPQNTYGIHDRMWFPYGCDFLKIQSLEKGDRPVGGQGRIGL